VPNATPGASDRQSGRWLSGNLSDAVESRANRGSVKPIAVGSSQNPRVSFAGARRDAARFRESIASRLGCGAGIVTNRPLNEDISAVAFG
jgi:hypothetical protein